MSRRFADITGERFHSLTAIEPTEQRENGYIIWKCKCDCGNTVYVSYRSLRQKRNCKYSMGCDKDCLYSGKLVTYDGTLMTYKQIANLTGVAIETVRQRYYKKIPQELMGRKDLRGKNNEGVNLSEIARRLGVSRQAISARLKYGWTIPKLLKAAGIN